GAALEHGAVEVADGLLAALRHLDEAEAARAAGLAVADDLGAGDVAVLAERLAQVVRGGLEGEVADVQVLAHGVPFRAARPAQTLHALTAARRRRGRQGRTELGRSRTAVAGAAPRRGHGGARPGARQALALQ